MTPPPSPPRKPSPLAVLKHRNFALYWGGQAVSMTGTWMQVLAQNWVVVTFTTSAFALGLLNFASALPMMILTLFGGVAADRMEKRRILIVTQVFLMSFAFVIAALYGFHLLKLWHLYALAVCSGIASAYDMPASQALTPELVEREEIPQAIALNNSTFHGSRIIGPALAGFVIHLWGIVGAFLANGMSFIAVILSLLFIKVPKHESKFHSGGSPLKYIHEGFRYVRERPRLLILMGFSMLITLLVFPNLIVLMPLYAKKTLNVGSQGFSYLMSSSGLGAMIGSLMLLNVPEKKRVMRIGLSLLGTTAAMMILGLSHSILLSCAGIFLNSLSFSTIGGLGNTIIQEAVPGHLRGRVMSLNTLTFVGIMPFASLIMTGLADLVGIRTEFIACGLIYGLACLILFRRFLASPAIADYEHSVEPDSSAPAVEGA